MTDRTRKILNMVLAVLVSIAAWIFVVYNYDPMTEVTYTDVPVSFTGEETLAERGLAVADTSVDGITVTLRQKRVDTGRLSVDNIDVKADVSGCVAGDNNISLDISSPKDTTVIKYDTETVDVSVGRTKTETMDIKVVYSEGAEENAEPVAYDLSRMQADVTCTEERMKQIDKIAAVLDPEDVGETVKSYTSKLSALDREGNVLPHVVIYPSEISLDASAGFTKEVDLTVPVKDDTDDDNYTRAYSSPDSVVIKGPREDIDNIGVVRAYEIDISDMYEDGEVPIEYNLPEGVVVADESLGQTLKVKVTRKAENND